jgi:hypothetical protein
MVWDNDGEILKARYRDLQLEQAAIATDYQRAKLEEDAEALAAVIERHDANYMRFQSLNNAAMQMQRAQPALTNRYGLSPEEAEIAEKSFSGANFGMTKDAMHQVYAEKKAKLHHMRATGEYRRTTDATG